MNDTSASDRGIAAVLATWLAALALAGCVVQEQRPMQRIAAEKATTEVAADELLDVGVRLFDPNVPEDAKQQEKERILPEVRKAESRYIPITGHAVDFAPIVAGKVRWDWPLFPPIAQAFKDAAGQLGVAIVWGGDCVSLRDGPHGELDRKVHT